MSSTIVVTGASRGLGLEFVRQYLAAGHEVIALARDPDGSPGLSELRGERLRCIQCDVADPDSVQTAAAALAETSECIDLLIQNAGIKGATADRFGNLDFVDMARVFAVNAYAPLRLSELCMAQLRRSAAPKIIFVTSRMGSIGDNDSGGWWSYRMSKAALNMACQNLACDLRGTGIATMVVHPGWVRTDMGCLAAPLSVEESVTGMRSVIDDLEPGGDAVFRDFAGTDLPW